MASEKSKYNTAAWHKKANAAYRRASTRMTRTGADVVTFSIDGDWFAMYGPRHNVTLGYDSRKEALEEGKRSVAELEAAA